jgi:alkylhydroperoxidase family enzyme
MRLPYVENSPTSDDPTTKEIYHRITARRAPEPLQELDLTLLHSPHVADGWNSFLGAIRTRSSLGDDIREIAICRVAVLNKATYEWEQHAPLARKGGVDEAGLHVLATAPPLASDRLFEALNAKQEAVVRFTDEMTRNVRVSHEVFEGLRREFSDQEVVEITATVCKLFYLLFL